MLQNINDQTRLPISGYLRDRTLAYPIKKEKKGIYTFMQVRATPSKWESVKTYLSHQEPVLRHEVFLVDDEYDYQEFKKRTASAALGPHA